MSDTKKYLSKNISAIEILNRDKEWMMWNNSLVNLWDEIENEHDEKGHEEDDVDDCEECISHFENMSVQRRCDKKTLKKIMCGFSLDEHKEHLRKITKKIEDMNISIEI